MLIAQDAFTMYNGGNDIIAGNPLGPWDYTGAGFFQSAASSTRFGVGTAMTFQSSGPIDYLRKNSFQSGNPNGVFVAHYFYYNTSLDTNFTVSFGHLFRDGGNGISNVQFSICAMSNGSFALYNGNYASGGSVVAVTQPLIRQAVYDQFQFRVIVHNTSGEFQVRKNGNTSNDFSVTGINTRGGSSNNFVNGYTLNINNNRNNSRLGDLIIWDNNSPLPNNWIGDVRSYQLMPQTDYQRNFSANPGGFQFGPNGVNTSNGDTYSANTIYFFSNGNGVSVYTPPSANGYLANVTIYLTANITGNIIFALYDNSGLSGGPGKLIASNSAVLTNPTGNAAVGQANFVVFPGQPYQQPGINVGATYWFAMQSDTSFTTKTGTGLTNLFGSAVNKTSLASNYPTLPANINTVAPGSSSSTPPGVVVGFAPWNANNMGEATQSGDSNYVYDTTVGNTDLYIIGSLPANAIGVVSVSMKGWMRKGDANTRAGTFLMNSGPTQSNTGNNFLSTSYIGQYAQWGTDPNTANQVWTVSAVNNILVGVKVTG